MFITLLCFVNGRVARDFDLWHLAAVCRNERTRRFCWWDRSMFYAVGTFPEIERCSEKFQLVIPMQCWSLFENIGFEQYPMFLWVPCQNAFWYSCCWKVRHNDCASQMHPRQVLSSDMPRKLVEQFNPSIQWYDMKTCSSWPVTVT